MIKTLNLLDTNSVKGYSSIKKLDVFSSDKYQDRFSNLSRFEKSSNKLNLDLSTCFNSMLKIKNLKQSVESKKVKNFMNNLTTEKEVTLKNTKALYQLNDSKGKITKSSAIQKTFDENLNHHNKSRDFSMNSTAIGSVIGDLHNITNSKLIKEIYSYR